ncbi:MAG: ABC transporter substrate-binding protein [Dehalococcoidia bacterium]|nr:ABC transporter substrate-binding protein [Dehalococcoidia bacterium]
MKKVSTCLIIILIVVCMAACTAAPAAAPEEGKVLKIGSVMPFSGPGAQWGLQVRPVLEIYADEINRDGGIKVGDDMYTVELYFADGPMSPAADAAAARSLVYDKGVKAIISYFGLGYSTIAGITTPEKVILNSSTINMGAYNAEKEPYSIFGFPAIEMSVNQAVAVMQAFPQLKTLCWTGAAGGNVEIEKIYGPVDEAIEKEYGFKSVRLYYPEGTTNFTAYISKMADMGVDVLFTFANPIENGLLAKQRYQLGYKWPIIQNGAIVDLKVLRGIVGSDEAMQGICGNYSFPWVLKKVEVAPRYLDMANRIKAKYDEMYEGKDLFAGGFGVGCPTMGHYLEGVQVAGTIDPDEVMKVLRGGTIETFLGKYTLSGKETYGSPVVVGYPCGMGIIKGKELVYLNEKPLWDVDHPVGGIDVYKSIITQ